MLVSITKTRQNIPIDLGSILRREAVTIKQLNDSFMMPLLVAAIIAGAGALVNMSMSYTSMNEKLTFIVEKISDHESRIREMEHEYYRGIK